MNYRRLTTCFDTLGSLTELSEHRLIVDDLLALFVCTAKNHSVRFARGLSGLCLDRHECTHIFVRKCAISERLLALSLPAVR